MAKRNKYVTYKKKKSKRKKYFTQNKFKIKRMKTHKNKKLRTKKNRSIKKGGRFKFLEKMDLKKEGTKLIKSIDAAIMNLANPVENFRYKGKTYTKEDEENPILEDLQKEKIINENKLTIIEKIFPILNTSQDTEEILKSFDALKNFGEEYETFYDVDTKNEIERISHHENNIIKYAYIQSYLQSEIGDKFDDNKESINTLITNVKEQLKNHKNKIENDITNIESKIESVKNLGINPLETYDKAVEEFEKEKFLTWKDYKKENPNEKISEVDFYTNKNINLNNIKERIENTTLKKVKDFYNNIIKNIN